MKSLRYLAAFLIILMPGCASVQPIQICGMQPIGSSQGVMVVRMHCEPEA